MYVRCNELAGRVRSQTEFLEVKRLVEGGRRDNEISQVTGIPRRTISGWRRGERRIRSRSDRGGCGVAEHDFSCIPPGPYAYLLGLYLGDGCISQHHRKVYSMRITLDSAYPGIIKECCAALESVFPDKTAHRGSRRRSRCVDVSMWSKHWPCLIPQHGSGRKHLRAIRLAPWQEGIITSHRKSFIRGLIHSDGTRIVATERKGSYVRRAPRYAFSNLSEDIKRLFCESCDALEVRWTRPSDHQIAIYRKASVALLDEFVGPKR
jgi:hypothetical protein